jgi:hypothetical protein
VRAGSLNNFASRANLTRVARKFYTAGRAWKTNSAESGKFSSFGAVALLMLTFPASGVGLDRA